MLDKVFNVVEFTKRNVFLTGKAGTGKTTFLNNFMKTTSRQAIVVAPTGIAAINAGGVTIHSLFGLPLTTFIPSMDPVDRNEAINIPQLFPHFKYRKEKLKLLQALEILVIDEVSMLRADVLDMIDLALKAARRSVLPFGGVQLLLIGDLYQLPPVVKRAAAHLLRNWYPSPFFFESKALQQTSFITVELDTIYRQSDPLFIDLLNSVREGDREQIDFSRLNRRCDPGFEATDGFVYLVSHNHLADSINAHHLELLQEKAVCCKAIISGDFKESLYPNDPELVLKPGTQVMFIRNDTSEDKRYYNGRLASVISIDTDKITVLPDDSAKELTIERELWENKRYYPNDKNEIEEEVVGSYEQFPFRLAWAVTIHKSQGLTFDKVIIDAGHSFTSGQVYVALSRCRTLEGIVLKSPIGPENIFRDQRIADFHKTTNATEKIDDIYEAEKHDFAISRLMQLLNVGLFQSPFEDWIEKAAESHFLNQEQFEEVRDQINKTVRNLENVFERFQSLVHRQTRDPENQELIISKASGAVHYFFNEVNRNIFVPLKDFYSTTKGSKGLKTYNGTAKSFMEDLESYLNRLQTARFLDKKLFTVTEPVVVDAAVTKKPSHMISFELLEEGKSAPEIAALRNLSLSTVFSHFSKIAGDGNLDIYRLFPEEQVAVFKTALDKFKFSHLTDAKNKLPQFEFHELRVLISYFSGLHKRTHVNGA